jgi:hypothetical protein
METSENRDRPLRSLTAALSEPRGEALPRFEGFGPVDAEEIAGELDLYVQAAESGQRGEPPQTADLPDPVETSIEAAVESCAAFAAYRARLAMHDATLRSTLLRSDERRAIDTGCKHLVAELSQQIRDAHEGLVAYWRAEVDPAEAHLREFQERQGLHRPPKVVSRVAKTVRALLLAGVMVGSSIGLRRLLGDGSAVRMVVAVLASAFLTGAGVWFARRGVARFVVRGAGSKLLGIVLALGYGAGVLGFGVLLAHLRDVLVDEAGRRSLDVWWHQVSLAPLALTHPASWLVLGVAIVASIVVVGIAAGFDELHPGYGAIGRRRAAADAAYWSEVARVSKGLEAIQQSALDELHGLSDAMQQRDKDSSAAVEARSDFHGEFLDHLGNLAAAHEHLCRRYREINAAVQNGNVPLYFVLEVERPACLADPGLPALRQSREGWQEAIERVQACARTWRRSSRPPSLRPSSRLQSPP